MYPFLIAPFLMQSRKQILKCSSEVWKNTISHGPSPAWGFKSDWVVQYESHRMSPSEVICRCTSAEHSALHHTGGKQGFTHLLDIREQQRDHSVCYLLCSSKGWHNGGSIKHKENSQLSWVARTLWKDLVHRKKSVVQTSGQVDIWKAHMPSLKPPKS